MQNSDYKIKRFPRNKRKKIRDIWEIEDIGGIGEKWNNE